MLTDVTAITTDELTARVWQARQDGYRFVTMTCTDVGDAHDVLYHFDKGYVLKHFRVRLVRGAVLPSISGVFFAAVLVENEMKDLFGVEISGLAIDYKGRFILSEGAPSAPLNKGHIGIGLDIRDKGGAASAGEARP